MSKAEKIAYKWRSPEQNMHLIQDSCNVGKKIVLFDTETTGLKSDARIAQFSGVLYIITEKGLKAVNCVDRFIDPEIEFSKGAAKVTGLNRKMLSGFQTETDNNCEYTREISAFLHQADVIAAYNAPFDVEKLRAMSKRTGVNVLPNVPVLDVLPMARDMLCQSDMDNFKLETVVSEIAPDKTFTFHSSWDDVQAMAVIFCRAVHYYEMCQPAIDEMKKKQKVHVSWASKWKNPNCPSQTRIRLMLTDTSRYGDIFWDIRQKAWRCKQTKSAMEFFRSVDLCDVEKQVLSKYGYRYSAKTMDELEKKMPFSGKSTLSAS